MDKESGSGIFPDPDPGNTKKTGSDRIRIRGTGFYVSNFIILFRFVGSRNASSATEKKIGIVGMGHVGKFF